MEDEDLKLNYLQREVSYFIDLGLLAIINLLTILND